MSLSTDKVLKAAAVLRAVLAAAVLNTDARCWPWIAVLEPTLAVKTELEAPILKTEGRRKPRQ
jgi:hypothetical protein